MWLANEHFSFNSIKGQCTECEGAGETAIQMHILQDIFVECMKCNGKRYLDEVLTVQYKGYSIVDLLVFEFGERKGLFKNEAKIDDIPDMLEKAGLSYSKLGQSSATLSGGESQSLKLAKELCTSKTDGAIFIRMNLLGGSMTGMFESFLLP